MQQVLAQMQQRAAAQQATRAGAAGADAQPSGDAAEQQPVQVDEWIVQFVELLKEHCGIDPDKPLEAQEVGLGLHRAAGRQAARQAAQRAKRGGPGAPREGSGRPAGRYSSGTVLWPKGGRLFSGSSSHTSMSSGSSLIDLDFFLPGITASSDGPLAATTTSGCAAR